MFRKRIQVFRSFLLLNDLLVLTACWFGAFYLRFFIPFIPVTKGIPPLQDYLFFFPFVLLACSVTFYLTGIYTRYYNRTQEWLALFKASFMALMILVFITFFFHPLHSRHQGHSSPARLFVLFPFCFADLCGDLLSNRDLYPLF